MARTSLFVLKEWPEEAVLPSPGTHVASLLMVMVFPNQAMHNRRPCSYVVYRGVFNLSPPTGMKVSELQYSRPGGQDALQIGSAKRERKARECLVKVLAASLNPVDWKLRVNRPPLFPNPKGVGCDLVGVVEECDEGSRFKKGDRVFSLLPIIEQQGALSEAVVIKENHLALAPNNLSVEGCAALPLVGLTVMQAFAKAGVTVDTAPSVTGLKVLIHAGAGGVGSIAIQYAKRCGLFVYTTCSERNVEFVKSLGADVAIDYNKQRFEDVAKGLDIVFDVMGGDYELRSMHCIKSSGVYLTIMNSGWATKVSTGKTDGVSGADSTLGSIVGFAYAAYRLSAQFIVGPWYKFCVVRPSGKDLSALAALCESGSVKPVLDSVFPLEEYHAAFARLEAGHARGKIIIKLPAAKSRAAL